MAYRNPNRNRQDRSSFREREDSGGYNIRNMAGRDDTRERSKPFDQGLAPDQLGSSEWVHDRYQDDDTRPFKKREPFKPLDSYRSAPAAKIETGIQMTIRDLPYDVNRADLQELCERFGNPIDVNLIYDRTDRSTGVAHITYEHEDEARLAVREIDGAKAYGQTVRANMRAPPPKRSLFDRIQLPNQPDRNDRNDRNNRRNRERDSPREDSDGYQSGGRRNSDDRGDRRNNGERRDSGGRDRARPALDRYIPPHRGSRNSRERNSRERDSAPLRPRNSANRIDRKQGRGDRDRGGRRGGRNERPKKTQEQMDMELDAYFNKGPEDAGTGAAPEVAQVQPVTTIQHEDMELDL